MSTAGTRAAEIGAENVFDFSLGNPNVPVPEDVKKAMKELLDCGDDVWLHGYTSGNGDAETRKAIAEDSEPPVRHGISSGESVYDLRSGCFAENLHHRSV